MNALVGTNDFAGSTRVKSGFHITQHDRLTIEGKSFDWAGQSGDTIFLSPSIGDGLTEQFTMGTLSRMSSAGAIRHEIGYYLPDDLKPVPEAKNLDFQVSDLKKKEKKRFYARYSQIKAIEELVLEGKIQPQTKDIENFEDEISTRAAAYLNATVSERDLLNHEIETERLPKRIAGRVRRGGSREEKTSVAPYSADYLRKLYKAYEKFGPAALADRFANCGHRSSILRPEEQSLLMDIIRSSYLTLERKSIKITVNDVRRAFTKENAQRAANDQLLLRVPGRDMVRNAIQKISLLRRLIARYGREHAMKKLRPVGAGLEIFRPGQRVEMDEQCIDLQSLIYSAKLHKYFGTDFLEAVGLDNTKARWWLVLAIDCRTRVILGMKLTRNPTTSAAQECLRMIMSDKGAWSDGAGALSGWSQALKPEVLVTDNGPAFKSEVFTNCCLDLRITILRTIAGVPGMRGTVERMFHTAGLDLMPRLKGRTFSNPLERGDYNSEDRACLDAEDLALILVRWVVDIYHNTEHEGLGGRTPLQQWEADMDAGNYPVSALPDTAKKRLAFGRADRRKLGREGIVVMGVHYHCQELAMHFLGSGSNQFDIRWDMEDIGAISVFLDGRWLDVPAVHDRFKGMNFHVWQKVRRALRSKSASRKVWDEETVFRAIDQIEELVEDRSLAFGIIDTSMTDKQFKKIELDFFASFRIGNTPQLKSDTTELGREISPRAPDPEKTPSSAAAPTKRKIAVPSVDVETTEEPELADSPNPHSSPFQKQSHPAAKLWQPRKSKEDGQ